MKRSLFTAILFLSLSAAFAQDRIPFYFGPDYKPVRKHDYYNYLGNREAGLIQLAIRERETILVNSFDVNSLALASVDELDISNIDRHTVDEGFLRLKNNYYWLLSNWDKSSQQLSLSYVPFDLLNRRLSSSATVMLETGTILKGFETNLSPDTSKLLILYTCSPIDRNTHTNYTKVGFHVFDQGMNKLWGKEYTMPYHESEMRIRDYAVDNNGYVYVLTQVYDTDDHKERRSDEKPRYHLELLRFNGEGAKPDSKVIELNDRFITSTALTHDPMGNIVCAGFYYKQPQSQWRGRRVCHPHRSQFGQHDCSGRQGSV